MKKININLSEIEFKDLDGFLIPIEDFVKGFANFMFFNGETIEIDTIARGLHKGDYEATKEDLEALLVFLNSGLRAYKMFVHLQIVRYFQEKLNKLNNLKSE